MFESIPRLAPAVFRFGPDIVFSQHELIVVGDLVTRLLHVPHVVSMRDLYYLPRDRTEERIGLAALDGVSARVANRPCHQILSRATARIASSQYIQTKYEDALDLSSTVIYALINEDRYAVESPGEHLLHVTPTHGKGIDITLEVASRMPDEEFLLGACLPRRLT